MYDTIGNRHYSTHINTVLQNLTELTYATITQKEEKLEEADVKENEEKE